MLVLAVLALPVASTDTALAQDSPSEYESPDGLYFYRTSGSSPSDYASEVVGLLGCSGTVVVQSALEGYPLKKVSSLSGCNADTLVMPASINSISDTAFLECTYLERIYFLGDRPLFDVSAIPEDVDIYALEGATGWEPGTEVLDCMEYIDDDSHLIYYVIDGKATVHDLIDGTEISIPSEFLDIPVLSIGAEAFKGTDITSLTINEGVETIGVRAFYNCESLSAAELPESLRIICDEAFRHNIKLTNIDLRNTEFIGFESFRMCYAFTEIIIPDTVTRMCGGAFYVCNKVERVVIGVNISEIEERMFGYGLLLSDLTINGDITSIGNSAFYECLLLSSISMEHVMHIGTFAFYKAESLSEIHFGNKLKTIGGSAFRKCKALVEVHIPDTLTSLGTYAFSECTALTDIHFEGEMPVMGKDVFYRTDATVHYSIENSASWENYDGKVEIHSDNDINLMSVIIVSALSIVVISVIAMYIIKVRRKT